MQAFVYKEDLILMSSVMNWLKDRQKIGIKLCFLDFFADFELDETKF